MALDRNLTDVCIVLYGFNKSDFEMTAAALVRVAPQIRTFRILLSGSHTEYESLVEMINGHELPNKFDLVHRYDNLGFSGGHNLLLDRSFQAGSNRCLVLNSDIDMTPFGLQSLLDESGKNPTSLMGPTLAQIDTHSDLDAAHGDFKRTDSLGIGWSADARHFDIAQGSPWQELDGPVRSVNGVTGACLLVTKESYETLIIRTGHFFDELFVAYREDAELGIRAGAVGIDSRIVPTQGIAHVRSQRGFARTNPLVNLLGVRNRFLILWVLGAKRPGNPLRAFTRDILVIGATLTIERSSMPGLIEAWRVRRYCKGMRDSIK